MGEAYYKSPYSASTNGGRWNPSGSRMIYASSDPAVAQLEYLCINGNGVSMGLWHMVVFEIANEKLLGTVDPASLPQDWAALPHSKSTQGFGKLWLDEKEYPFLRVPTARLSLQFYPNQFNLLINPDYPNLTSVLKVKETIPFNFLLNKIT
jgi:RES domain-containing protein